MQKTVHDEAASIQIALRHYELTFEEMKEYSTETRNINAPQRRVHNVLSYDWKQYEADLAPNTQVEVSHNEMKTNRNLLKL